MSSSAQVLASLKIKLKNIEDGAREAVDETAEAIFESSTGYYCPVDKGVLKSSAKNELTSSGSKYTRVISYGRNGAAPYAKYVHEIPYHHEHGSWKYLTIPFNIESAKLVDKIKAEVRK